MSNGNFPPRGKWNGQRGGKSTTSSTETKVRLPGVYQKTSKAGKDYLAFKVTQEFINTFPVGSYVSIFPNTFKTDSEEDQKKPDYKILPPQSKQA